MNEKSWLKIAPSRAVRVLGEVQHPGRIEWSDEMSFLDLLAHVGGPTLRGDTTRIEIVTPDASGKNNVYTFNLDSFISKGKPDSAYRQFVQVPLFEYMTYLKIHQTINHNGYVKALIAQFMSLVR